MFFIEDFFYFCEAYRVSYEMLESSQSATILCLIVFEVCRKLKIEYYSFEFLYSLAKDVYSIISVWFL